MTLRQIQKRCGKETNRKDGGVGEEVRMEEKEEAEERKGGTQAGRSGVGGEGFLNEGFLNGRVPKW